MQYKVIMKAWKVKRYRILILLTFTGLVIAICSIQHLQTVDNDNTSSISREGTLFSTSYKFLSESQILYVGNQFGKHVLWHRIIVSQSISQTVSRSGSKYISISCSQSVRHSIIRSVSHSDLSDLPTLHLFSTDCKKRAVQQL